MNSNYSGYLLTIIIIIIFVVILAVIFVRKLRRRQDSMPSGCQPVTCGNASVFFDKQGNAAAIPYVQDKYGNGKATADVRFIRTPYNEELLGRTLRDLLNCCRDGVQCTPGSLMDTLGYKSWKDFTEGKRNVSIYFKEGKGIVLNSTTREPDGSYRLNINGYETVLQHDASDEVLGHEIIRLLHKCRS